MCLCDLGDGVLVDVECGDFVCIVGDTLPVVNLGVGIENAEPQGYEVKPPF